MSRTQKTILTKSIYIYNNTCIREIKCRIFTKVYHLFFFFDELKKKKIVKKHIQYSKWNIPFIQFFSGWKWKDVLCHDNMLLFHGYEIALWSANTRFDFSDTPADTPRDTGCTGSNGIDTDDGSDVTNKASSFSFSWTLCEFLWSPTVMAKNKASNNSNNPEKIMRVAFFRGLRLSKGPSMVGGPLGRGE